MNFEAAAKMILGECPMTLDHDSYQEQVTAAMNALRAAFDLGEKHGRFEALAEAGAVVDQCLDADHTLSKLGEAIRGL